jgi:uncharacterized protein YeaO (DUF488 family)
VTPRSGSCPQSRRRPASTNPLKPKSAAKWRAFVKKYRVEMSSPENGRTLDVLAALSQQANFSVGCCCEDESHCHRSVLRALLSERGAKLA